MVSDEKNVNLKSEKLISRKSQVDAKTLSCDAWKRISIQTVTKSMTNPIKFIVVSSVCGEVYPHNSSRTVY